VKLTLQNQEGVRMNSAAALDPLYLHIRIVLSIILGLSLTTLLKGMVGFVQHPRRNRFSIVHFGWVLWSLVSVITFWWWEYKLADVTAWTFESYTFVLIYCSSYFVLAALLFPEDIKEYAGLEDYVLSRRFWLFGLIAAITLLDIGDTVLKGSKQVAALGLAYDLRIGVMLIACAIGAATTRRTVHIALVCAVLAYQIWYTLVQYSTLAT